MQSLKLTNDLFPALVNGAKRATVRAGKRDVVPGPLTFESVSGDRSCDVLVYRVSYTMVRDLTLNDAHLDNAKDVDELVIALRRFYPDLKDSDIVTVIEFWP